MSLGAVETSDKPGSPTPVMSHVRLTPVFLATFMGASPPHLFLVIEVLMVAGERPHHSENSRPDMPCAKTSHRRRPLSVSHDFRFVTGAIVAPATIVANDNRERSD